MWCTYEIKFMYSLSHADLRERERGKDGREWEWEWELEKKVQELG